MIAKPARHRIYYGWYIVLALFFLGFSKAGFTGFLFSLFLKPMTEEFGWSRTAMTGAVTFGTILAAALGYWIGSTIDRHGARLPMSVATFFAGGAFLGLGFVNGLFTYYLVYGLGRAVTQSALGDAMVAAVISKWFLRLRGFTIALGNMGAAVAGTILAVVCQALIESYSWRYAWAFLGVLTLIVSLPPLLIFLRRSPEDMGLAIFGAGKEPLELASPPASQHGEAVYNREYSLTLRQALRTPAFWLLTAASGLVNLTGTAVIFHLVAYLTDIGLSGKAAAGSLGLFALGQTSTILVWGALADRINPKVTVLTTVVLSGLASFMLLLTRSVLMAYSSTYLLGLAFGGFNTVVQVIWAVYFGRRFLGSIRGASQGLQLMANAVGPLTAAVVFDLFGSYRPVYIAVLLLYGVTFCLVALARRPEPGPLTQRSST